MMEEIPVECRTCCRRGEISISLLCTTKEHLVIWLERHLGLEISADNGMPNNLCVNCLKSIKEWILFKDQCENSQNFYKNKVDSLKSIIIRPKETLSISKKEITPPTEVKSTENKCDKLSSRPTNQESESKCHKSICVKLLNILTNNETEEDIENSTTIHERTSPDSQTDKLTNDLTKEIANKVKACDRETTNLQEDRISPEKTYLQIEKNSTGQNGDITENYPSYNDNQDCDVDLDSCEIEMSLLHSYLDNSMLKPSSDEEEKIFTIPEIENKNDEISSKENNALQDSVENLDLLTQGANYGITSKNPVSDDSEKEATCVGKMLCEKQVTNVEKASYNDTAKSRKACNKPVRFLPERKCRYFQYLHPNYLCENDLETALKLSQEEVTFKQPSKSSTYTDSTWEPSGSDDSNASFTKSIKGKKKFSQQATPLVKNPRGRPRKYKLPEQTQNTIKRRVFEVNLLPFLQQSSPETEHIPDLTTTTTINEQLDVCTETLITEIQNQQSENMEADTGQSINDAQSDTSENAFETEDNTNLTSQINSTESTILSENIVSEDNVMPPENMNPAEDTVSTANFIPGSNFSTLTQMNTLPVFVPQPTQFSAVHMETPASLSYPNQESSIQTTPISIPADVIQSIPKNLACDITPIIQNNKIIYVMNPVANAPINSNTLVSSLPQNYAFNPQQLYQTNLQPNYIVQRCWNDNANQIVSPILTNNPNYVQLQQNVPQVVSQLIPSQPNIIMRSATLPSRPVYVLNQISSLGVGQNVPTFNTVPVNQFNRNNETSM